MNLFNSRLTVFQQIQLRTESCVSTGDSELDKVSSGWITPRITDYKHTRQDRRMQKEMAFTHTKKATKPKPSKIIQLQATRKKIYWTT
jgi:hypothetical protein